MVRRRGFTLVEVMVSMAVFTGTMGAFAAYYATSAQLKENGRNTIQALTDGRTVLEAIRNIAQAGGLIGGGGVTVLFPEGDIVLPAPVALPGIAAWTLSGEVVSVSYADPVTGVSVLTADPLPVTVTVAWTDRGHPRAVSLRTLMTRRR